MIKSRRMRWTGHVTYMGEGRGVYSIFIRRPDWLKIGFGGGLL
jgi:hypothetical protein